MPRDRAEIVVISWRDIPAQVNGRAGRERHQVLLPPRFQRAIDRAAKIAGKKTVHEYVAEWRRRAIPVDGDTAAAAAAADAEAARLDAAFPKERLAALVRAGGWETPADAATDPTPGKATDNPGSAS